MPKRGLHISANLVLPLDTVTSTLVVYGGKGMGKTNLGAVLVEEFTVAGLKWAVLDPMGVWWGIRHGADGKVDGLQCLILGGAHGDIPIEPTGGAVVADLVADEGVNVIIDISRNVNGEMWSIAERIRFMNDYGKQLFKRQGSLIEGKRREPMMQVIDEAARFIPQMIRSGQPELAMCTSTWSMIVEEGRNVGLGVTLLTQRSARLNKDVAELADLMLAFRTVGPNSINAVMDWLSAHMPKAELTAMRETVRSLPVGSCLVVSPGWLQIEKVVPIRRRTTFDSSATPKPGESALRVRGTGAKPNLQLYAERMKETIERAKENSIPELKRRIRELETQKPAVPAKAAATKTVEIIRPDSRVVKENAALRAQLTAARADVSSLVNDCMTKVGAYFSKLEAKLGAAPTAVLLADDPVHEVLSVSSTPLDLADVALKFPPKRVVPTQPAVFNGEAPKLGKMALMIAQIAAGYAQRGEGIEKKVLAAMCGTAPNGSFYNRLSDARVAGAITTDGSMVFATPEGRSAYADQFQAPETTEEVLALWMPKLGSASRAILTHLVSLRGEYISRTALAEAIGTQANGSFYNRLSDVRLTGLLLERGKDVAANPQLLFLR